MKDANLIEPTNLLLEASNKPERWSGVITKPDSNPSSRPCEAR